MSNEQPDTPFRSHAPHARRGAAPALAFGLIPAAVVAGITLLTGILAIPPRYIARASFVVDWSALQSAPDDSMVGIMHGDSRATFMAEMDGLPKSEQELSELLDGVGAGSGSQADRALVIAKLQKRLRITSAGQSDHIDLFTVEMRDDDPGLARAAANWVLQGIMSKLDGESNGRDAASAWRPFTEAGSASPSNLDGVPVSPVKTITEAQVKERGFGYGLNVLLAAVAFGAVAGGLGLMVRQLILAVTALKLMAEGASRRRQLQSSAYIGSRGRRRIPAPQRPILLRPLPQLCVAEALPDADGMSSPQI